MQGSNIQINYEPPNGAGEIQQSGSLDGETELEDELPQQSSVKLGTIRLDDNIELVSPKYVANVIVMPRGNDEHPRYVKSVESGFDATLRDEAQQAGNEYVDIPTQDVGEEELDGEIMRADNSQNIAYSYSNFIPHYEPAPRHVHYGKITIKNSS